MVQANKVTCWNRAGFVQKFQAKWSVDGKEYATGWTDYYANPESRSFDLDEYSIPDGANVSVEVAAYMCHENIRCILIQTGMWQNG